MIASSGYSEEEASRRFPAGQIAAFLQKPYSAATLARADEIGDPECAHRHFGIVIAARPRTVLLTPSAPASSYTVNCVTP